MKPTIHIDENALKDLERKAPVLFKQGLLSVGNAVEAEAVESISEGGRLHAEQTGNLKGTIVTSNVHQKGGHYYVTVGSNAPYAQMVHDGTGIYGPNKKPITPKNAKVLAWEVPVSARNPKGMAFAKSVEGMKPRPFLLDAVKKIVPNKVVKIFRDVFNKAKKIR